MNVLYEALIVWERRPRSLLIFLAGSVVSSMLLLFAQHKSSDLMNGGLQEPMGVAVWQVIFWVLIPMSIIIFVYAAYYSCVVFRRDWEETFNL